MQQHMPRYVIARPAAARLPGQVLDAGLKQLRGCGRKRARQSPVGRLQHLHLAPGVAEMQQNSHQFQIGFRLCPGVGGVRNEGACGPCQRHFHIRCLFHALFLSQCQEEKSEATP
ncbi:hypothetical protein LA66_10190 [Aureimonas altamirensis]|uniref:Uncharacterized protein n=1 Tax=Aureimonas altamirensis TaxID=370622 RepID=A0A0B1Q7M0_9HYPH|nr:hypothetical protein LA66_10190 [Aureimonas altamirensis]